MPESKTFLSRASRGLLGPPSPDSSQEPKQRRLMVVALSLLLVALVAVLYHDRDFWFPDADEAESQTQDLTPVAKTPATNQAKQVAPVRKSSHNAKPKLSISADTSAPAAPVTISSRTVLPPLEVEVIAGDAHQRIRPPSSELKVDLSSGTADNANAFGTPENVVPENEPPANVTSNAAERVEMSGDASEVVSRSVQPGYPMLARQMKVQGSVVLLAMISRDGGVQDLRVLSGPPILATAAREAVRQWHFKPHLEGSEAVETIAKVTVNFTISTN